MGRSNTFDKIEVLEEHAHNQQCVYPTAAGGVTVTGAVAAWTLGAFAEIVPVNTITSDFDIHFINIEAVSAAGTYELYLYAGETKIAETRFTVTGTPANTILPTKRMQTPIVSKNTQIQAKVMNSAGGSETCTVSLEYHSY